MAHTRTVEAIERVMAAGPEEKERVRRELALAQQALSVLDTFAKQEAPKAPDVHVYVPEREVTIQAPDVHVEVAAPELSIPAPQVDVHLPEQPPPNVTVEAPEIHVEVEAPKPRAVRVEEDEDGTRRYVQE